MAVGSVIVSSLLVLGAVSCTAQQRFVDDDGLVWVATEDGNPDRVWAVQEGKGQEGGMRMFPRRPLPETWPVPASLLVRHDGSIEIRYEERPIGLARNPRANGLVTVPTFTLMHDGTERPGVWMESSIERPCLGSINKPIAIHFHRRYFAEGGPYWDVSSIEVTLSHPPCGDTIAYQLADSEQTRVWNGYAHPTGGKYGYLAEFSVAGDSWRGPKQLVHILELPNDSVPPAALPALARVEARLNNLLSLPGNGAAQIDVFAFIRFDTVTQNPNAKPGNKPNQIPFVKATTETTSIPTTLNQVRNAFNFRDGGGADDSQDANENYLYQQFGTGAAFWARTGPGPFPGVLEQLGDGSAEILVPNGLQSLFSGNDTTVHITFDDTTPWDYDPNDGIAAGQCDFEGTLTHEMLHALGFVSNSDVQPGSSGTAFRRMTVLDLFRFDMADVDTSSRLSAGLSGTDNRRPRAVLNSDMPFMALGRTVDLWPAMSGGTAYIPPGDARQTSHWQDAIYGGPVLGIMNPTGTNAGTRGYFANTGYLSQSDICALDVIGWHIDCTEDPGTLIGLASPAPGLMPVADATGVPTEPTFVWQPPTLGPNTLAGVTLVVYADPLGPNNPAGAQPIFRADDLAGSSFTLPDGILTTGTTYSWTTVTRNPWSFRESGPYAFTTQGPPPCPADVNGDGVVDPNDFSAWVAAYNLGDLAADANGDGFVTPADFGAWIASYNAGC